MANIRISDLTDLTTPSGASVFPISHQGSTRKITVDNLSNYIQSSLNTSNPTFATTGQLNNSGIRLTNLINSLSGSLNSSGSNLRDNIASLSGLFTGYTGSVDSIFATDIHLTSTGSGLLTTINSLSGSLNLSGIRLTNMINSLSGASVLLYGNQTNISGIKTFVDNIGIGTASPAVELHVQSINEILRLETTAATGRNYLSFYKSGAARQGYFGYGSTANDSLTLSNDIAGAGMQFNIGGALAMSLDSSSNLGIGTTAPLAKLDVSNKFRVAPSAPSSQEILAGTQVDSYNDNLTLLPSPSVPGTKTLQLMGYGVGGGWRSMLEIANVAAGEPNVVLAKNAGNVGIGIASPSEKLQVVGNILANNLVYNTGDQNISGVKAFASRPTVNGTGVLLSGEAGQISSTIVQTTGTQNISGLKTFTDTGVFNNIQINNKLLTSYNYLTGGIFNFDNFYTTIVNSSLSTTGVLPSGITSGINYYVKNLNTGILTITGSGQRTIDGFTNINLYQNDSVNLLGMNNIGYTGWISTLANGGVS